MDVRTSFVLTALSFVFLSSLATAQDFLSGKWEVGAYIGGSTITDEIAAENFIEDTTFHIGGFADFDFGYVIASIGLDYLRYDDNASFSQMTINDDGDIEASDSSADALSFNLAVGPAWREDEYGVLVYGQLGYGVVFNSERSINFCDTCVSEDIEVEGGVFGKLGAVKSFKRFSLGLHYIRYFGDEGLENGFQFSVGTAY